MPAKKIHSSRKFVKRNAAKRRSNLAIELGQNPIIVATKQSGKPVIAFSKSWWAKVRKLAARDPKLKAYFIEVLRTGEKNNINFVQENALHQTFKKARAGHSLVQKHAIKKARKFTVKLVPLKKAIRELGG